MHICVKCGKRLKEVICIDTIDTLYVWNQEKEKYEECDQVLAVETEIVCANCREELNPEDHEFWRQNSKYADKQINRLR